MDSHSHDKSAAELDEIFDYDAAEPNPPRARHDHEVRESRPRDEQPKAKPEPLPDTSTLERLSSGTGTARQLSVIGPTLVFKGNLSAEEDLLIQGRVEGTVRHGGANLTIGAHGTVHADIDACKVIVQGKVRGDVRASESVVIEPSANVQGDIFAPRIGIKDGAHFKGSIDMDGGAETYSSPRPVESSASGKPRAASKAKRRSGQDFGETNVDAMLE
jgi:cytoskeletal protein CcmA (bactofilin family)